MHGNKIKKNASYIYFVKLFRLYCYKLFRKISNGDVINLYQYNFLETFNCLKIIKRRKTINYFKLCLLYMNCEQIYKVFVIFN